MDNSPSITIICVMYKIPVEDSLDRHEPGEKKPILSENPKNASTP